MAPYQSDDNVIFLYHCLQHCSGDGKIDWEAVAVAIGSTKGASAIRYRRLKEKIEQDTGSTASKPSGASKAKKSDGTRKRKAPTKDEDDDDDDKPDKALPQVDGAADGAGPKRQTRGKKLD
ncbi:hypothetical protein A1O7_08447 [Cladophialophora yegresii CBS 114405]|uniref:Myb-like DNA-binding domain-containing protein n=1 Tax=Cladophialophora yegresii CBS 114405 TaxID=1182544 RepID=W9WAC8_9EURO|nr:uncharacterized protein A1O7_08447 [Cladophialophora yegresii CBS 114405]EXJ55519.1 hypothetical protein A1O7_08447 [Cladophialophora yegresii CBS 114405]